MNQANCSCPMNCQLHQSFTNDDSALHGLNPFTDSDLKRFSQWAFDCWETDKFYCRTHEIEALLARLEAAENYIAHTARFQSPDIETMNLKEAWRKAAGK